MEVEIKLLLPSAEPFMTLEQWQWPQPISQLQRLELANTYFDTPKQDLRKRDMGLRIRRRDQQRELTLKTAGKVVGGLHARPEYNVEVNSDRPDLTLLPAELFEEQERAELNSALQATFSTDFVRQRALLSLAHASLELALDYGQIAAAGKQQAIAELELELIDGQPQALLPLIEGLMQQQPLRLGLDSKAARGYRLAGLQPAAALVEQWSDSAEGILSAWQRNEERLLAGELAAQPLLAKLLVDASRWQTESTAGNDLAQWLSAAAAQLQRSDQPQQRLQQLIQQRQYGLCQLTLLQQLLG